VIAAPNPNLFDNPGYVIGGAIFLVLAVVFLYQLGKRRSEERKG